MSNDNSTFAWFFAWFVDNFRATELIVFLIIILIITFILVGFKKEGDTNKCYFPILLYVASTLVLFSFLAYQVANAKSTIDYIVLLAAKFVEYTAQLSTLILLVVFFGFGIYAIMCSKDKSGTKEPKTLSDTKNTFSIYSALLMRLLILSFAASTIPTGFSLILCALVKSIKIEQMSGLEVHLGYAGLSLIFMTIIVVFEEKPRIDCLWKSFKNNSEK